MLKRITIPCGLISEIWPEIDRLFFALFADIQIGVSDSRPGIQDLISRLIVNQNEISRYQNLSLGVDNQKQV